MVTGALRPKAPRVRDLRNDRTLRRWLDREWPRLAVFAYASFLAHGRGAIAFQLNNPRCHYETYAGTAVPDDLGAVLAGYDPEKHLVLHFQDARTTKAATAAVVLASKAAYPEKWPATVYGRFLKGAHA